MTTIKIVSRYNSDTVLFECDAPEGLESGLHMRHALEKATAARKDLRLANLRDANLRDANLSDANLRGADLRGANLRGADLRGADLRDANLSGADLRLADLRGANLSDANLRGANLRGADLRGADLRDANLSGADLRLADLRGANLSDANLRGADLRDADLRDADLRDANLSDANLRGADLRGANLRGADLRDANLSGANLRAFRADFWDVLLRAPAEIAGVRAALIEGRVDGSTYSGECACLVGTIGNVRHVKYTALGNGLKPDSGRPAEQWFMSIRKGDTPETNRASKFAVEWLDELVGLLSIAKATP